MEVRAAASLFFSLAGLATKGDAAKFGIRLDGDTPRGPLRRTLTASSDRGSRPIVEAAAGLPRADSTGRVRINQEQSLAAVYICFKAVRTRNTGPKSASSPTGTAKGMTMPAECVRPIKEQLAFVR